MKVFMRVKDLSLLRRASLGGRVEEYRLVINLVSRRLHNSNGLAG